ncbi:unnamed protein product [Allacma fusca]|uniref:non-specific serine/threonine protein kinase n=1 Tax=Allacma fusca TaxID=39272 RepID=A0A8J2KBH1_9HEXA|nr:unnamed protein product [Allacma fusca]
MYWCQLWKKIHKPLIALAVIGFVSVTATQTEIEFDDNDAHRNNRIDTLSDNDILVASTTPSDANSNPTQLPKSNDLPTIPVSSVPQLPHCRGGQDKIPYKSDERNNLHRDTGNSSDETVVSPSRELVNERHVLVATLDGKLSLLDQGGRILWSIATGQIFSSTISSLQLNENGKWINLIPSLTGGLYKYDGISLHPMPLSAETLLRRSFKLTSDVVMTGGKELRTFGIDLLTGAMRYECGMEGCTTQAKAESPPEEDVVLVVKKQLQTVRAIDSATGSERWNFSVATHELALAGVTEGCYEGEQKDSGQDHLLKVVIPEGLIIGADKSDRAVWQHKFSSPISQAWVLENGIIRVIDPIKNSPRVEESPALYIGIHKQQFYVQESHTTAERLENAFELQFSHKSHSQRSIEIGWKPSSAIKGMTDSKAVAPYQPEFNGFYVLEKDEMKTSLPAIEPRKENSADNVSGGEAEDLENVNNFGFTEGAVQIIFVSLVSLWFWWKEVLGISLLTAVVLNLVLMRPVIRAVRTQTVREMWGFFRNQQEERALLPRKESDTLELPFTHRTRTRTTSSSSNTSQLCVGDDPNTFRSQYLEEFKPIQCLGRGGFGVVFEAKKIIDDRNYAVKRIPLPNREKSRDKVMREVKALAKLDHRNIVRYFNAWIEKPPLGWLEHHDPLWLESKTNASSANVLSSFEMTSKTDYDPMALRERRNKKEYSLISMPSKTPVEDQVEPDDSFIVFATEGDESVNLDNNCFSECALKAIEGSGGWDTNSYAIEQASSTSLLENSRVCDSIITSVSGGRGFFARPTFLDIPSMQEESGSQIADSCEVDESIEEGIDVANNASYTPSIMYLYIQQELCQKRTLQEWLRMTEERNLLQVVNFFTQTVEAVEYIHLNKLIHRDLKPGNIFLASGVESEFGSSTKERITVKIGDFGLATTASNRFDTDTQHTPAGDIPATKDNLTGHVGTHLYMSPEQSRNKPYDFKVDIYSLGLIFFELLVPFSTEMERYESLSQVRKMSFPRPFLVEHQAEYEFISKMVSHDPEQRPNATVIKKWLKSHLLNVSPTDSCSPSASRGIVPSKSLSADSSIFPFKKGRFLSEQERFLNKTQSCM